MQIIQQTKIYQTIKINYCLMAFVTSLTFSCNSNTQYLTPNESATVKDNVTALTANISKNITNKGPVAWLNYFEDSPSFFMASDGQLAFNNYQSARAFIRNKLVKLYPHIKLQWNNVRIDPISQSLASIGADFHEELTDANGKTQTADGYFTSLAHYTENGWKLRSVHWSVKPQANAAH